jgi:hypothetical protein
MVLAKSVGHEVEGWFFNLDTAAACIAQRQQLFVHRLRHIPNHLTLVFVFRRVNIQEKRHNWRATSNKLDRFASFRLSDAPQLRIIERPVLDPTKCGQRQPV